MAEETAKPPEATPPGRNKDEIALEMMKFIAVQTGYGKGVAAGAGFHGNPAVRPAEEYADALMQLFQKCRGVLGPQA
jgi:hypothetical protein